MAPLFLLQTLLFFQEIFTFTWIIFHLLLNCCSDGWYKMYWVQIQVIAENFSKLIWGYQYFIFVP